MYLYQSEEKQGVFLLCFYYVRIITDFSTNKFENRKFEFKPETQKWLCWELDNTHNYFLKYYFLKILTHEHPLWDKRIRPINESYVKVTVDFKVFLEQVIKVDEVNQKIFLYFSKFFSLGIFFWHWDSLGETSVDYKALDSSNMAWLSPPMGS